jgi:hypothetical protein
MSLPRALIGSPRCMARPARPAAEIAAVRAAAEIVSAEMGLTAAQPLAREIARRVVVELRAEIDGLTDDPLIAALQRVQRSPFVDLATCPEIDTISLFVERRAERLHSRAGRYLTAGEQQRERRGIEREVTKALTERYSRHIRVWRMSD